MQYQLKVFHDEDLYEFRTLEIDGEPWFVGVDVCSRLEIKNPSDAYSRLDADDLGQTEGVDKRGRKQTLTIVNESGLFSLILRSDKPEAKRFKRWVTHEVLPAIRRMGAYSVRGQAPSADWQPFHDRISTAWGVVPEGYFSIFKEMADIIGHLITNGVQVDHRIIPDISMGICWSKFWQENGFAVDYGERTSYPHSYPPSFPQSKSNPQWANCYPEEALGVFRRWARNHYLKKNFQIYLSGKVSQGQLTKPVVEAALIAVGAKPPPKPSIPRPPL